jgi:hypothetical protein
MIASFVLIAGAIFVGDAVPETFRILMLVGGLAPLFGVRISGRVSRDPGADYPYPTQENVFGERGRR